MRDEHVKHPNSLQIIIDINFLTINFKTIARLLIFLMPYKEKQTVLINDCLLIFTSLECCGPWSSSQVPLPC